MKPVNSIKIFIINLKRSTERRHDMQIKMNALGFDYEFYDAIDGVDLPEHLLNVIQNQPRSFKQAFNRNMTRGEIGCAMSHLNLYKKIVDEKIQFALILEDDIDFDGRLKYILNSNKITGILKNKLELILLGYSANGFDKKIPAQMSWYKKERIGNKILFGIPTVWNWLTIGYFISNAGAARLITDNNLPRMPADFLTANSPKYGLRLGIANRPIVWPGALGEVSYIGDGRGHPHELQKKIQVILPEAKPKRNGIINVAGVIRVVYSSARRRYHKIKKVFYNQFIKTVPSYYLYVSDRL